MLVLPAKKKAAKANRKPIDSQWAQHSERMRRINSTRITQQRRKVQYNVAAEELKTIRSVLDQKTFYEFNDYAWTQAMNGKVGKVFTEKNGKPTVVFSTKDVRKKKSFGYLCKFNTHVTFEDFTTCLLMTKFKRDHLILVDMKQFSFASRTSQLCGNSLFFKRLCEFVEDGTFIFEINT